MTVRLLVVVTAGAETPRPSASPSGLRPSSDGSAGAQAALVPDGVRTLTRYLASVPAATVPI